MTEIHWGFAYFLFVSSINALLALLVYFRNRHHLVNRLFAASVIGVVFWTISDSFLHLTAGTRAGLFWGEMTFASASLIPVSFLAFAKAFPSAQKFHRHFVLSAFGAVGILFFFTSFTSLIVSEVRYDDYELVLSYGKLYPGFALYFLLCFATSFYMLWKKYHVVQGIEQLRMRYLFLGTLVAVAGAAATNLVIPLIFRTSRFSWFGPVFTVFAFGFIAHAIIRHRLMNIRLVIRKGVIYLLAATIAGGLFVSLLGLLTTLAFGSPRNIPLWVEVSLVLLIALLFHPLMRWIQISLDRYLYRESYDYQRIIREVSKTIGTLLDFQSLLKYVCELVTRTIRPESISIYIRNLEARSYIQMAIRKHVEDNRSPSHDETVSASSPLPAYLARSRTYFLRDAAHQATERDISRALEQLNMLGGELVLPILHEEELLGFIVLASKLSGDAYFAEDIDLLSTLVGQAAIRS